MKSPMASSVSRRVHFGDKPLNCIIFVVLTDDVYTTGATMEAAAHELKLGGAEKVVGMTIASGAI